MKYLRWAIIGLAIRAALATYGELQSGSSMDFILANILPVLLVPMGVLVVLYVTIAGIRKARTSRAR